MFPAGQLVTSSPKSSPVWQRKNLHQWRKAKSLCQPNKSSSCGKKLNILAFQYLSSSCCNKYNIFTLAFDSKSWPVREMQYLHISKTSYIFQPTILTLRETQHLHTCLWCKMFTPWKHPSSSYQVKCIIFMSRPVMGFCWQPEHCGRLASKKQGLA